MVKKQNCVLWIDDQWLMTDDLYITKDVETRFDTSNYELAKPLPKTKI